MSSTDGYMMSSYYWIQWSSSPQQRLKWAEYRSLICEYDADTLSLIPQAQGVGFILTNQTSVLSPFQPLATLLQS